MTYNSKSISELLTRSQGASQEQFQNLILDYIASAPGRKVSKRVFTSQFLDEFVWAKFVMYAIKTNQVAVTEDLNEVRFIGRSPSFVETETVIQFKRRA